MGMLSMFFISLEKTESITAGKVSSTSMRRTGIPFFIDCFSSEMKLELVSFVLVCLSLLYIFFSHL